jgi:predicted site-specific integrase-resolvase
MKKFYTPAEISKKIGVTTATVIRWCNNGDIESSRGPTGKGNIRIPVEEGDKILEDYFCGE